MHRNKYDTFSNLNDLSMISIFSLQMVHLHHIILVVIIELILKNEIIDDINTLDAFGCTCLHFLMGHIYSDRDKRSKNVLLNERRIARLFISRGVDESIKDKYDNTAKAYLYEMGDDFYDWLVGKTDDT